MSRRPSDVPIYPATPAELASVRIWTKAVDEELHPACSAITYIVSHRHSILRNGVSEFARFVEQESAEGSAARLLKWQWIQQGLAAPGAPDNIRLYDAYLHRLKHALRDRAWLVGNAFSMADIALAPYVTRLSALAMDEMWTDGRLPRVANWFERVRSRPTFQSAFMDWLPAEPACEMRENGQRSWPEVKALLKI